MYNDLIPVHAESSLAVKPPAETEFLTTAEVLVYLRVNLRTVSRLIKSGSIPAMRVGRQWRFRKQDVGAWLEMRRAAAQPASAVRRRVPLVEDEAGMDGLSVIRAARGLDAGLPVIIITGHSSESSAIEAVNLGVAGYLTKPFGAAQVLAAAARALGVPHA